eukprot:192683_1
MLINLVGHLPLPKMFIVVWAMTTIFYASITALVFLPTYYTRSLKWKTQRHWPNSEQIWMEIRAGYEGMVVGVLNTCIFIVMQLSGTNKIYSNLTDYSLLYLPLSYLILFVFNEVYQWCWHAACHKYPICWELHKFHHSFSNPTPICALASHPLDSFIQQSIIWWFPMLFPIYDLLIYTHFMGFSMLYGCYLHCGFDFDSWMTSPHNKHLMTAWHHNYHHNFVKFGVVENVGFIFNVMDRYAQTFHGPPQSRQNGGKCICAECRNLLVCDSSDAQNLLCLSPIAGRSHSF